MTERQYARNESENDEMVVYATVLILASFMLWVHHYVRLIDLVLVPLLGFLGACYWLPVSDANKTPLYWIFPCLIGGFGAVFHWQAGFEIFGFQFDQAVFDGFILSGCLSWLRRQWNAWCWYLIDRRVV